MEYKNLFSDKTEKDLEKLYKQYLEWVKTGMLGHNELGNIRDMYCTMGLNTPLIVLELDLLKTIAKYWFIGKEININYRDATKEEQESVNNYIKSISQYTGRNFYDHIEKE